MDEVDPNVHVGPRSTANFFWPVLDIVGINVVMWAVPYAMGSPFSKIGPSYWKNNLKSGFQWDDNEIEVNQFFHPYQGGLYYTAARVNGMTFWESIPYTMFGSWQWEYFMETEQASTNDFMSTTWGGVFFGEALYRLSNRILDESDSGASRFFKEFGAMAISPINGLDRVATGRAWADGPRHKPAPLNVDFRLGFDGLGLSSDEGWGTTVRTSIRFDYGDLYAKEAITTPFEAFNLAFEFSASNKAFGEGVDGIGVLMGKRLSNNKERTSDHLLAWTLDYAFFTNASEKMFQREAEGTYQLGEIGTGASWFARWKLGRGFSIDSELDVLAVPTGAVTSPYAVYESNRAYNYGIGGAFKAELALRQERWGRLYANLDRYLYHVVNGAEGVENVGLLKVGAYVNLYKGHGLGAAATYYNRASYYDDYADVHDSFWSGQAHYQYEW